MMMKDDGMAKDGMMMKSMTMQECKDHMAMSNKEGMKKDDAMMKKDTMCADMMKKGSRQHGDSWRRLHRAARHGGEALDTGIPLEVLILSRRCHRRSPQSRPPVRAA